jgi:hypothetical protein
MFLALEENPNCAPLDGCLVQEMGPSKVISHVLLERLGRRDWFAITGVENAYGLCPARAVKVGDSGDGEAYLVYGGEWGLRFRDAGCARPWGPEDRDQWSASYLLLAADDGQLRFA